MAKHRTTTTVQDSVKSMRRIERDRLKAAGLLGTRRKAGEHDGPTKANRSKAACRDRRLWD